MRLFLLLALAIPAGLPTVYAQQVGRGSVAPTNLEFVSQQLEKGKGSKANTSILGTPLVADSWTSGRVKTLNGTFGPVWLKYNLATKQLIWRRPVGDSLELNTDQISEFTLGDSLKGKHVIFRRYLSARIEALMLRTSFFEVCYDAGRSALLRQRTKLVSASGGGSPSLTEARPPSWQETTQYFVKRADNTVVPVRLNEKALFAALGPEHAAALTTYTKQEKLSLKKEVDISKLLAYYDTL
jgi:hypothetical protein